MILTISPPPKQGRIHGNPVADGWAGAVMRKLLAILTIFRAKISYRCLMRGSEGYGGVARGGQKVKGGLKLCRGSEGWEG